MRLKRFVLSAALLLLAWGGAAAGLDHYGDFDQAQPADAIVVLGSRVLRSRRPGPALTRRARHAAILYAQGLAPVIVCSGGLGDNPPTEARAACGEAERQGVPESAIVLEEQARSTEETSLYVAGLMGAHGWRTAILVSDGYHLYRAHLLFEQAGITTYPSPAQVTAGPMNPIESFLRANRELVAVLWYWFKTALGLKITDVQ